MFEFDPTGQVLRLDEDLRCEHDQGDVGEIASMLQLQRAVEFVLPRTHHAPPMPREVAVTIGVDLTVIEVEPGHARQTLSDEQELLLILQLRSDDLRDDLVVMVRMEHHAHRRQAADREHHSDAERQDQGPASAERRPCRGERSGSWGARDLIGAVLGLDLRDEPVQGDEQQGEVPTVVDVHDRRLEHRPFEDRPLIGPEGRIDERRDRERCGDQEHEVELVEGQATSGDPLSDHRAPGPEHEPEEPPYEGVECEAQDEGQSESPGLSQRFRHRPTGRGIPS